MAQNYYCKWCGNKYPNIKTLTSVPCSKNPTKGGKHELYEGTEKTQYVCKWCGNKYPSLIALTAGPCSHNPNNKNHEPAL